MILTLQSDFITLAKAKGISSRRILWVHALRASILSLMTSVALQISALISGAVIAEQFFGPRGLGDRLVFAIQQNDLLVIQALSMLLVVAVVLVNFGGRSPLRGGRSTDPCGESDRLREDGWKQRHFSRSRVANSPARTSPLPYDVAASRR